ncbi:MAG TPA: class I SAM-dependent methyltransferase [Burkholderiales bacterium]|nr:class I SAM-dependent methyltransferase [Burkholderiales bacterium]
MNFVTEARVLFALARGARRGGTYAERLQRFYAPQAEAYDAFRERLLHGRRELVRLLPAAAGDRVVELGAGTGRNTEFFGPRLAQLAQLEAVDLCPALLQVARRRLAHLPNARVIEADARHYRPARLVDVVYFSYALTMMPDWRGALDNALAMLRPGGTLGVVDFHLPAPAAGTLGLARREHVNRFWRAWFAHDGVHLSQEHLPYLCRGLHVEVCRERAGPVPYLPWLRVPYYIFVGRKPS